jgi:MFS family permease
MRVRGPGFRDVLGIREFRALWAAELFSILGDQLARVALALLVFQRTSSAALAALTYALTLAPAVLGGMLLSGLADRYPRRRVLIVTDLIRAALACAMAIPSLPLAAMWALVAALSMSSAPFKAAQQALLPQVLDGDRYLTGLSLRQVTIQGAQLGGYASGGFLLVLLEPHVALAANAATFLASAALIATGVRPRPTPSVTHEAQPAGLPIRGGGSRRLLPVVVLVCLVGLFVVPTGVAAPYGAGIGVGALGVGLIMAADPMGSVIGAWLLPRIGIRPSQKAIVTLAAASGIPLLACVAAPGLGVSIALFAASGALSTAYLILAQALVVELVPDHRRGRVMGQIAACLYSAQGLTIFAGGLAAEAVGPFRAVAGAGLLGTVLVLCVGVWWRRVARSRRDLDTGSEPNSGGGPDDSPVLLHDRHLLPGQQAEQVSDEGAGVSPVLLHDQHLLSCQQAAHGPSEQIGESPVLLHDQHLLPRQVGSAEQGDESPVLLHDEHLPPHELGPAEQISESPVFLHEGHLLPRQQAAHQPAEQTVESPVLLHDRHLLPHQQPRRHQHRIMAGRRQPGPGIVVGTQASQLWRRLSGPTPGRMIARGMACG